MECWSARAEFIGQHEAVIAMKLYELLIERRTSRGVCAGLIEYNIMDKTATRRWTVLIKHSGRKHVSSY